MSLTFFYRGLSFFVLAVFLFILLYYCALKLMATKKKERGTGRSDLSELADLQSGQKRILHQANVANCVDNNEALPPNGILDSLCTLTEHQNMQYFLQSKDPGKYFVELISLGALCTLMCGNHSLNFPDKKQYEDFKRYSSDELSAALNEICDKL